MIGNDVVDLQLAAQQSNWRRKGFLEKVFSGEEQHQIAASLQPERLVWLFWSMKEAAYKAHQRRFCLPRKLNWQDFECSVIEFSNEASSGVVNTGNTEYFTASEFSEAYIHTSAEVSGTKALKRGIFETSSVKMKQLFLRQFSEVFKVPEQELQIQKNEQGIPCVIFNNTTFFENFSFSGHGRFCAFSMAVNDL